MLDLKLSTLYLKSSRFQDSFLIAHLEKPEEFVPGSYMSDLLGYFGIGAGIYRRDIKSPPDWAYRYRFSQFPDVLKRLNELESRIGVEKAKIIVFSDIVKWFQGLLGFYAYHGIHFAIPDLRMFIDMTASYLNIPVSPDLRLQLIGPDAPPDKPVVESVILFEVTEDKDVLLGFGAPAFEPKLDSTYEFFDLSIDNHRFDWEHSSQLGTPSNLVGTLLSLKHYNFSASPKEEQEEELDFHIEHLNKIRRAV